VRDNLKGVLAPSMGSFNPEQAASAVELLNRIAAVDGAPSELQTQLVNNASGLLSPVIRPKGKWE
jgi:hypothetical protein